MRFRCGNLGRENKHGDLQDEMIRPLEQKTNPENAFSCEALCELECRPPVVAHAGGYCTDRPRRITREYSVRCSKTHMVKNADRCFVVDLGWCDASTNVASLNLPN